MSYTSHRRSRQPEPPDPDDYDEFEGGWFRRFVRKAWKPALGIAGIGIVAFVVLVGVAYAKTPVPDASQAAKQQATVFTYRDGTPFYKIGVNRENVTLDQIPPSVQHAVVSAEDKNFYNEPGISPTGILRALYSTATGRQVQGGSTITQQFARNYYDTLSQQRTVSRKFKEIMISVKVGKEKDKNWVLDQYLNTIYFGRGAYGIQAAAKTYFGKNVSDLTPAQGAYLAAIIQSPEYYPQHRAALQPRFDYVKRTMAEKGWVGASSSMALPRTKREGGNTAKLAGQHGYMYSQAKQELVRALVKHHLGGQQRLGIGGLRVQTTFSRRDVIYMSHAVHTVLRPFRGRGVQAGLAAVDPRTGEVLASYGGPDWRHHQYDNAFQGAAQAGSSFKPYVLATALKQGISLKSTVSGKSPRTFKGGYRVTNDSGENFGPINLIQATSQSVNTAYVELGLKVHLGNVIDTAQQMGVPHSELAPYSGQAGLVLGQASLHPVTQAGAYATFANNGKHVDEHVVRKVSTFTGQTLVDNTKSMKPKHVLDKGVSADATYAMTKVLKQGTAKNVLSSFPRNAAGKTGTTNKNKAAWFVGYTPQMSASVAMWRTVHGHSYPLTGLGGQTAGGIYGGTVPAKIWRMYMLEALKGQPNLRFPDPVFGGTTQRYATPSPTATPTQSESPTPTQSQQPTPSSHPTPTLPGGGPTPPGNSHSPCPIWGCSGNNENNDSEP